MIKQRGWTSPCDSKELFDGQSSSQVPCGEDVLPTRSGGVFGGASPCPEAENRVGQTNTFFHPRNMLHGDACSPVFGGVDFV